jgi:DNA-binding response OmpR family regulator
MSNDSPELHVLIVGGASDEVSAVVVALSSGGYNVKPKCAVNAGSFDLHLRKQSLDLVFWSDSSATFGMASGMELMPGGSKSIPIIELRQRTTEYDRVNALKLGAKDVVAKSNIDHLLLVVERELTGLSPAPPMGGTATALCR